MSTLGVQVGARNDKPTSEYTAHMCLYTSHTRSVGLCMFGLSFGVGCLGLCWEIGEYVCWIMEKLMGSRVRPM